MKRRWGAFLWGVAVTVLVGWVVPTLVSQFLREWRPSVSTDWAKARSYEFRRDGPEGVSWVTAGEQRWYFADVRFGARRVEIEGQQGQVLIFAPDGDGPYAYAMKA